MTLTHQKAESHSRLVAALQAQVAAYQQDKQFADQGLQLYKALQGDCKQLYRQVAALQADNSSLEDSVNEERVEKERTVSALREAVRERQELRQAHEDLRVHLEQVKGSYAHERKIQQEDLDRLKVRINVVLGEQVQERKAAATKIEEKESMIQSLETQTLDQRRAMSLLQSTTATQASQLSASKADVAVWNEVKRMVN